MIILFEQLWYSSEEQLCKRAMFTLWDFNFSFLVRDLVRILLVGFVLHAPFHPHNPSFTFLSFDLVWFDVSDDDGSRTIHSEIWLTENVSRKIIYLRKKRMCALRYLISTLQHNGFLFPWPQLNFSLHRHKGSAWRNFIHFTRSSIPSTQYGCPERWDSLQYATNQMKTPPRSFINMKAEKVDVRFPEKKSVIVNEVESRTFYGPHNLERMNPKKNYRNPKNRCFGLLAGRRCQGVLLTHGIHHES